MASARSPSKRASERSISATGGGAGREGSVGGPPNASDMAWRKAPHSSGVAGRRRESRSSATHRCLPGGSDVLPGSSGSAAEVGQGGHDPPVLVVVLAQTELGEDVLGVLLHG